MAVAIAGAGARLFRRPGPVAARGAVAALFGLFLGVGEWSDPAAFASALAVFLLVGAAAAAFASRLFGSRSLAVLAVVDAGVGLLLAVHRPWQGLATLNYLAGAWAMAAGLLEMIAAGTFVRDRATEGLEAASGLVLVAVGVYLGVFPETSLSPLAHLAGGALFVSGALLISAAVRLRVRAA